MCDFNKSMSLSMSQLAGELSQVVLGSTTCCATVLTVKKYRGKCLLSDRRKWLIQLIRPVAHVQKYAKYERRLYKEFFPSRIVRKEDCNKRNLENVCHPTR